MYTLSSEESGDSHISQKDSLTRTAIFVIYNNLFHDTIVQKIESFEKHEI